MAAVPEDDTRDEIDLREIVQRGLILFPAGQGPVLHAQILDAFGRAGLAVPIVQEASRALTMLSLVSAGLGVALLPENTRRLDFKGVRFVEIGDGDRLPVLPLALIAPRRPRPPIIDRVLSLLN